MTENFSKKNYETNISKSALQISDQKKAANNQLVQTKLKGLA